MTAILIVFDIFFALLFSFFLFDLGVYLKVLFIKKGDFKNYIKSKGVRSNNSPYWDLFYLLFLFFPLSIFYLFFHFKISPEYSFLFIYLYLLPISLVWGFFTNPDWIESIDYPKFMIKKIIIPLDSVAGLEGSIINWNHSSLSVLFYNSLKVVNKVMAYTMFALSCFVFVVVLLGFFIKPGVATPSRVCSYQDDGITLDAACDMLTISTEDGVLVDDNEFYDQILAIIKKYDGKIVYKSKLGSYWSLKFSDDKNIYEIKEKLEKVDHVKSVSFDMVVSIDDPVLVKSHINKIDDKKEMQDSFRYDEVIKSKIGLSGGVIENSAKTVIVIVPPLEKETELTLSFKKSDYKVNSGVGSPITVRINSNTSLMNFSDPMVIKVKYDLQHDLPVPYLVDEKNNLHVVTIQNLDQVNGYLSMITFHVGDYTWIYSK